MDKRLLKNIKKKLLPFNSKSNLLRFCLQSEITDSGTKKNGKNKEYTYNKLL